MGGKKTRAALPASKVTQADIALELHRLRKSQMRLVLIAEELNVAVPRSCCRHKGPSACAACTADWLAGNVEAIVARTTEAE